MICFYQINCFGNYSLFERGLNGMELLGFTIISLILISFLLWYYTKIPKSNFKENEIQVEKTSRYPKLLQYLLITIPCTILFFEFFNFVNLFTILDMIMLGFLTTLMLYLSITPQIIKLVKRPKLDNPIYQSTDIILQSNSNDANFIIAKKTTSTWVRILTFILIVFVIATPFQEFLGFSFF